MELINSFKFNSPEQDDLMTGQKGIQLLYILLLKKHINILIL